MQVLIVDDERDIGYLICGILRENNMNCRVVHNLEMARDLIRHQTFDFYFIDIKLPDGSGFDLVPEVNGMKGDHEVVMISAFDGEEERNTAKSLGIKKFINKPFSKKEILAAIHLR